MILSVGLCFNSQVMTETKKCRAFLGLGGNLGHPLSLFRQCRQSLEEHPQIVQVRSSALYRTPAVGGPADQPDYLNAALELETFLSPGELLKTCQELENAAGRTRQVVWGPRTLDIDLLLYADRIMTTPELTIPHPLLHQRQFVLMPLTDLRPDFVHPVLNRSIADLQAELAEEAGIVLMEKTW